MHSELFNTAIHSINACHIGDALNRVIRNDYEVSLQAFAELSKIPLGDLMAIIEGKNHPDLGLFRKLVHVLNEADGGAGDSFARAVFGERAQYYY